MKKALSIVLTVVMIASAFAVFSIFSSAETDMWVYGNGMENWGGSPNKGDEEAVTQILFCPDPWDAAVYTAGMEVTVRMQAVDGSSDDTFTTNVVTTYNAGDWGICRIEPCLMETPWIPVANLHYIATFTFVDLDGETSTITPTNDDGSPFEFYLDRDPIVPGLIIDDPDEVKELNIHPSYGVIENWGDPVNTYFIVGGTTAKFADKNKLAPDEGDPALTLKVVIVDETTGETYTISQYAFDNPGKEIYGDGSFLRIAVCDYGIVPLADHEYTVTLEFYDAEGKLKAEGTSDAGAFTGGNDGFLANGAVIPAEFPHMYDEGKEPDPNVIYGDVNDDGTVNKKDSLRLKQYLADPDNNAVNLAASDVNGDGTVNKKDSLRLKQYLAGWDVILGA